MTNPTRQETTDAHKALGRLCHLADNPPLFVFKDPHEVSELRQTILKALPTNLKPTMDEIEWDDDKHYLAEAEHPDYGKVIMVNLLAHSERISVLFRADVDVCQPHVLRKDLTPTGRRYTLTEVHND